MENQLVMRDRKVERIMIIEYFDGFALIGKRLSEVLDIPVAFLPLVDDIDQRY